jgi:DNA-binding LacI/PurR family transcriptional regulator/anti-anti-sigma regulatory factor
LLVPGIGERIGEALWHGVLDATYERGANLIAFAGGGLNGLSRHDAQANAIYDLVGAESVDGLLIWGALLHHVDLGEAAAFCHRFRPLPLIGVGVAVDGVPAAVFDNYGSMGELVAHLIDVHGCRRIAFVRGPEGNREADERYRAYVDVLAERSILLDPRLVAPGGYDVASGVEAMALLLDERKLVAGSDIEAVVAANDNMAAGVLDALDLRGLRVPDAVAVVGFDDAAEAAHLSPPLTTVHCSFYEAGRRATEVLLALIAGEDVPERTLVPSSLTVRRSCGCLSPTVLRAVAGDVAGVRAEGAGNGIEVVLAARRADVVSAMIEASASGSGELGAAYLRRWAEQLLDGFVQEVEGGPAGEPGAFAAALFGVLKEVEGADGDVNAWQDVISVLRRHLLPYVEGGGARCRAEDVWGQARVSISEVAQRAQARRVRETERRSRKLRGFGQALSATSGLTQVLDLAARELVGLCIPSCYLSLYESAQFPGPGEEAPAIVDGETGEWARLLLAYDEDGRVELGERERRFRSRQLVPREALSRSGLRSVVAEPLYHGEERLGFVLLEVGPREGEVYEALRGQLSSLVQGALLRREREFLQREVIEAQRRALRELSTPIIPVLQLPEEGGVIVMPLIGNVDTLRARDVTRALMGGIRDYRARVVILDVTGVPVIDSGVVGYLNRTIRAARLKGARTIVTGISDAVAETIVDLGVDWSGTETKSDLQTGLLSALEGMDIRLVRRVRSRSASREE